MSFYSEITELILSKRIQSKKELHEVKKKLCKKYNIDSIPPDSEILARLPSDFTDDERELTVEILRKKPTRTISGVAIVAVMTSPAECPHGRCIPCPGGPSSNTPQSYTGYEPASMRALLNNFDPFMQTTNRLKQLKSIGHAVDKVDFIIMGGTFTSRSPFYQGWFVKRCFDALNGKQSSSLDEAKKINEISRSRCIGLTVETRPDWFRLQHADHVLNLGATRVELGVQSVYDDVLYAMGRGHTVMDSVYATRIAKDCGFKVCYHMMPGLVDSNEKKDIDSFRTIFEDDLFKPDMIKIYPTLTVKGTQLYELWKQGEYLPLTTEKASKLVAEIKKFVPEWVRIQRIQRDIPLQHIEAGVNKSNLRQLAEAELKKHGHSCRCIRCREIGHKSLEDKIEINEEDIVFDTCYYEASGSSEVFISLVDKKNDYLVGYLRLRDIVCSHRLELQKKPCMIIRELKVLGRELPIGKKNINGWQHRGFGKELVDEAERVCFEKFDKKFLFVLSGVGVKEYYRKLGFVDDGVYLSKNLHG
ncbi:MAG: tRNA uridine(34) 5-carboxymethylaminomethyl modification radical SAM/GNAT enzyme Elp3 [Candidatus Thermoplasmatota archaeon]|jgi:elongator complex protein 3|nr:tRNA uridine(34) 5-carboxymethylaminomethyl modification radical SAM/GNAT enzyme Elp3 [Candidatus Thermoplasmatota archaeon]